MKITFFSPSENITGSKHLIQTKNHNLLLDCGLFQGRRRLSEEYNRNLPFDAKDISSVILSHAHLDHCGMLPILVREGFEGKIYCTGATAEIARYILEDCAAIQEQDCMYFNSKVKDEDKMICPIYTKEDVAKALNHFEIVDYFQNTNKWIEINEDIRFKFYDAGHILGSAVTLLEIKEDKEIKRVVFTGDIGRDSLPILRAPEYIKEEAQTLLCECTYGDKIHPSIEETEKQLKDAIDLAIRKRGKIIVPAFSLGRTQSLIYILHKLMDNKEIPCIPIYVDSPLSKNLTEIFSKYKKDFDQDFFNDFGNDGKDPFSFGSLRYINSIEDSKKLNSRKSRGPFMVITASGMAEGGRVLHYFKNNISNPNNIILITGYQAENTLGRKIQDRINPVNIFKKSYKVKAKVITLNQLSSHGDQKDLLDYIKHIKGLKNIFLVHTEEKQSSAFSNLLKENILPAEINIPKMGESFEL